MTHAESSIDVSVIVPVWNDRVRLGRCLDALAAQTMPRSRFEVIVVDNGSTDGSDSAAAARPDVLLMREPAPGSYHARNRGLAAARGAFVAFTDSDCVPEPDWLEQAVAAMRARPDAGVGAGRVVLFVEPGGTAAADRPSRAALAYERAFGFDQSRNAARGVSVTANLIAPRAAVLDIGGFDASRKSGGDFDLCARLSRSGLETLYLDQARVAHPARGSLRALRRKRRRLVGGSWRNGAGGRSAPAMVFRSGREAVNKTRRALLHRETHVIDRVLVVGVVLTLFVESVAEIVRLSLGGEPLR